MKNHHYHTYIISKVFKCFKMFLHLLFIFVIYLFIFFSSLLSIISAHIILLSLVFLFRAIIYYLISSQVRKHFIIVFNIFWSMLSGHNSAGQEKIFSFNLSKTESSCCIPFVIIKSSFNHNRIELFSRS